MTMDYNNPSPFRNGKPLNPHQASTPTAQPDSINNNNAKSDTASSDLSIALLKWVQSFSLSRPVTTFQDLRDGDLIWEILHDIDPEYFDSSSSSTTPAASSAGGPGGQQTLAAKESWIARWQKLKHINRLLTAYIRDVCGTLEARAEVPDLKRIATGNSTGEVGVAAGLERDGQQDMVVLLKTILRAAMYSPASNQRMGRVVVGLGPEAARTIALAMAEMEDESGSLGGDARELVEDEGESPGVEDPGALVVEKRSEGRDNNRSVSTVGDRDLNLSRRKSSYRRIGLSGRWRPAMRKRQMNWRN